MSDGHLDEELQDLLDGRADAARQEEIRAHLARCPTCRSDFEALARVKRVIRSQREPELPPGLERSVRQVLAREERPWVSRRSFVAAAAGLVLGTGGAVWWTRSRRGSLPAAVALDYEGLRSGRLSLEMHETRAEALEAFFRAQGISFPTRVLDLAMMRYRLVGGRRHDLDGRPSALLLYEGDGGRMLACQMFAGRLDDLPPPADVRQHRGFRFQIYRERRATVVFWQEGAVVCVLAGDFGESEVLALAYEKAML